jgi:hypothetical protein
METEFKLDGNVYSRGEVAATYKAGDRVKIREVLTNGSFHIIVLTGEAKGFSMYVEKDLLVRVPAPKPEHFTKPEIIEVYIDYRQHLTEPAMVQQFINALTGDVVQPSKLDRHTLESVHTDSCGRKVLVFKKC